MSETETSTELILGSGVAGDIWEGTASTFVPMLKQDMPIAERKEAVRNILHASGEIDDKLNLVAGEMLYEVHANEYWKDWTITVDGEDRPYSSFEEYCEVELAMKKRKAYTLRQVYERFCVELDIPLETLRGLQWTKARAILPVVTDENWEELLGKIKTLSKSEVEKLVKSMKADDDDDDGEPDELARIAFKLHPEQFEVVTSALKVAESMSTSEVTGNQLHLICMDFISGAAGTGLTGALAKLDVVVKNIERAFGVELEIKGVDEDRYSALKGAADAEPIDTTSTDAEPDEDDTDVVGDLDDVDDEEPSDTDLESVLADAEAAEAALGDD